MLENQNEELGQVNADAQVEAQDVVADDELVRDEEAIGETDAADKGDEAEDEAKAVAEATPEEVAKADQAANEHDGTRHVHAPLEEMPLQDKIGRMNVLLRRYKKALEFAAERDGEQKRVNDRLLTMLKVKPQTTKKELSFLLDMSSRDLTDLLAKFEEKGLVALRSSEGDGYETIVELTEKGASPDASLDDAKAQVDPFDALDEDEKAQLADISVKVSKSLEAKLVAMGEDPDAHDERRGGRDDRGGRGGFRGGRDDDRRGGYRGGRDDRGGRGGFRGGRDDRGGRGGFRGGRDDDRRGGYRGGRDDRGGRGGFRGGRDDDRRGGYRGGRDDRGGRGGFRGGRDDDRRGGYRGGRDDRGYRGDRDDRGGRGGYGHRDFHDNSKPGYTRAESRSGYTHAGRYSDFDFSKSKKRDEN